MGKVQGQLKWFQHPWVKWKGKENIIYNSGAQPEQDNSVRGKHARAHIHSHIHSHRMGSVAWTSSGRWLWLFFTGKKNVSRNRWRRLFRNVYKQRKRQDRKDLSMYFTDGWRVLTAQSTPWAILWLRSIILMVDFSIPTLRFLFPADSAHPPAADEESHKMNHAPGRLTVQRPFLTTFPPILDWDGDQSGRRIQTLPPRSQKRKTKP